MIPAAGAAPSTSPESVEQRGAVPAAEPRSRLLIEYVGTGFSGWACQEGRRTIQGELERALSVVLRRVVPLTVAGRTDAGVHAWGQVASHAGDPARVESLNALLSDDVAVVESEAAEPGFDARRDATSRAYCYRLLTRRARSPCHAGRALHWPHQVDLDALQACASALPGRHDFTAFTPTDSDHVRFSRDVQAAAWRRWGEDLLEFWIEADAFMRHMNRVLVGTMLEVAGDRRSLESFTTLLNGASRAEAGPTAPPHGLYLAAIGYRGANALPPGHSI